MMDRLRESNESNVQLKSLDRLKDNIIKDVSHELKSPLAQLRLALEMWLKRTNKERKEGEERRKDRSKGDHFIEIIKGNISRLNNTVESILTLADIESGTLKYEKEILSLRVLINQVTDGQRLIAEKKNLLLTSTFSDNLHEVLVDKTQIVRVVSNLIDNAIKYTESGEITVSAVRKNDDIEVAVKDTGIGIDRPKNNQDQVFDRFYQEKASSHGIGVGLSICENIIKAHHGKIWVESKGKGNGSTFKFTLPVPLCGEFCSCCG
jgi:signal transduction histidine kinase